MIQRLVKMEFKSENTDDFLEIFRNSHPLIRAFKGCISLRLIRDISNNSCFFTVSDWESEDALYTYRQSDLFKKTWAKTRILFNEKAEAWSTEIITEV